MIPCLSVSYFSNFLVFGFWDLVSAGISLKNSEIGQQMTGSDQVQGSFYYR
jgi:hypothetical protein